MSVILDALFGAPKAAHPWTTPEWWGNLGDSVAGVPVSTETALKISTVYACVGLISETIASLPLVIYRYLENEDGREKAKNHPLYTLLHDQANVSQTAVEFIQMMQAHALLRGSGYARIVPGDRGFADQLVPVHPDLVEKESLGGVKFRYQITDERGRKPVNAEDIFEVGGLSLDGINTLSVVSYARDSFGLTMAAENYGGRFFRNDSRPGGVLKTAKTLTDGAAKRVKSSWEAAHTAGNQRRVAVLEEGLEWQQIGISPEEAQFLGTREFQAEDVCRWFRVPPHMVGLTSKATSWGSGIEEMTIGFLTYTLRPWLTRWKQAIRRDLILATDVYFADFVVNELLRGDTSKRYNAYSIGRQWGWLSVNDIRRLENMNPVENGDIYLQPMNMTEAGWTEPIKQPGNLTPSPSPEGGEGGRGIASDLSPKAGEGGRGHYRLLAEEAAGRVVRKEMVAMKRAAEKAQAGTLAEGWDEAVAAFYEGHTWLVAQTMRMPMEDAVKYCQLGQLELQAHGVAVMEEWPVARVKYLVDLALGETDGDA